jgi:hypothetical protein
LGRGCVGAGRPPGGDKVHNHSQDDFGIPGFVAVIDQISEWFQLAVVTGTFSVGTVGGTASGDGAMMRGKATVTIKNFGPPFPSSN